MTLAELEQRVAELEGRPSGSDQISPLYLLDATAFLQTSPQRALFISGLYPLAFPAVGPGVTASMTIAHGLGWSEIVPIGALNQNAGPELATWTYRVPDLDHLQIRVTNSAVVPVTINWFGYLAGHT